ncbi:MAG TPA: pyridine nucleotide-disulfide oxidoreductase [Nocardioidaceae bacterium]|nr:pyridine nucleotide-disulfide oxidoreductase [Nocardioidaceae bacterium]
MPARVPTGSTSASTRTTTGPRDLYGLRLTTSPEAAAAYNRGIRAVLNVQQGGVEALAESIAHDPTFAMGHAALALLGYEQNAPIDLAARLDSAQRHAARSTERERGHVAAVLAHTTGDNEVLLTHLRHHPRDALLLTTAVPTIAFAGVTTVPEEAWSVVEGCASAYGSDWWYAGLLAFIRQEQGRFDEAYELSCRSMTEEPGAGHSAHARTHVHYETGDHTAGLTWLDDWIDSTGPTSNHLAHFSWHAALHELAECDLAAVRSRWADQLAPPTVSGTRALVDSASLLWRWALTPGASEVPEASAVLASVPDEDIDRPGTGFMAMHAAVALCAAGDTDRLRRLHRWCRGHADHSMSEVAAPLAASLLLLTQKQQAAAADGLGRLREQLWRLGGSEAQRDVVEDTQVAALLASGRCREAQLLLDRRLDRRPSARDIRWREAATGLV